MNQEHGGKNWGRGNYSRRKLLIIKFKTKTNLARAIQTSPARDKTKNRTDLLFLAACFDKRNGAALNANEICKVLPHVKYNVFGVKFESTT